MNIILEIIFRLIAFFFDILYSVINLFRHLIEDVIFAFICDIVEASKDLFAIDRKRIKFTAPFSEYLVGEWLDKDKDVWTCDCDDIKYEQYRTSNEEFCKYCGYKRPNK